MTGSAFFILILISYFFYSLGAVVKAGKAVELRPQIIDFIIIILLWAGAIYSNIVLDVNKWFLIAGWVVLSIVIGVVVVLPRKFPNIKPSGDKASRPVPKNFFKRLWQNWGDFNVRLGGFQTRMAFSLLFLILIAPVALAVRWGNDPLSLKHKINESYWVTRMRSVVNPEEFRKQF